MRILLAESAFASGLQTAAPSVHIFLKENPSLGNALETFCLHFSDNLDKLGSRDDTQPATVQVFARLYLGDRRN